MNIEKELLNILQKDRILKDEPMKAHTSFKVGGLADYFLIIENEKELKQVLKLSKQNNIPLQLVGNGTNLLVTDKGIRGIVIKLNMQNYKIERTKAIKEDAIQDQNIVFESDEKSLSEETNDSAADDENSADVVSDDYRRGGKDRRRGRNRFDRRGRNRFERKENPSPEASEQKEKQEAVILYNSHEDIKSDAEQSSNKQEEPTKEKSTWWKKLIKG